APQRCSTSASIIICAIRTTISRSTSGDAVASVSSNHSLSAGRMSLAATSRSPSFAFDSCEGSRSGRPHVTSIFPHGHQGDERVQTRTPPPWTLTAEPAVAALSDLHGDLVATFTTSLVTSTSFDPFGAVTAQTGAATTLGYQGEYTDPDTGKVNMHARWYQPGTGTFTSRDTATLNPNPSVQANRYTYANGSPLTGIDPTGYSTVSTGVGSGGSTGYAGVGCSGGYLCLGAGGAAAQNGGCKYPPAGVADMTYGVGVGSGCVDSSSRICHETYQHQLWWTAYTN